jgi:hypothetical protein
VRLTTVSPVVLARLREARRCDTFSGGVTALVESESFLGDELEGHTLNTRSSTPETSLDDSLIKTKNLKDLGTLVRGKSGDTHLTHDLENTTIARVLVVTDQSLVSGLLLDKTLAVQLENALHGKVGVDGISTVSEENTHVVDLTSFGSLNNESSHRSPLVADKVMVDHSRSQNSRDGHAVSGSVAVRQYNDTVPGLDGGRSLVADLIKMSDVTLNSLLLGKGQVNSLNGPLRVLAGHVLDGVELLNREDRARKQKTTALGCVHLEQVTLRTNVTLERHDNRLSDGVDGRVSDLGEQLSEVVVKKTRSRGQACQWGIVTHGTQSLLLISSHGSKQQADLLVSVTVRVQ